MKGTVSCDPFSALLKEIELREDQKENCTVVVGLSGGVDSMVLSELLYLAGYNLVLAHFNFLLRGDESDRDEAFVRQVASERWPQSTLVVRHEDTRRYARKHGLSIEMAARELRYKWFDELLHEHSADRIAVGHHLNDQIETVLLNLIRGTGGEGLTGMSVDSRNVWRPLLHLSRREVEKMALERNIPFVVDSSNEKIDFTRNKIRHEVIPLLETINPSFAGSFGRSIEIFGMEQKVVSNFVATKVAMYFDEATNSYDLSSLQGDAEDRLWLYRVLAPKGFTDQQVSDILGESENSRRLFLGKKESDAELFKDRLYLYPKEKRDAWSDVKLDAFPCTHHTSLGSYTFSVENGRVEGTLSLDPERCSGKDLRLSTDYSPKDPFTPFGMKQGKKEVGTFLKESGVPLCYRHAIPAVMCDGKIIAVPPLQIDEHYRTSKDSKRVLSIRFIPNQSSPLGQLLFRSKK